DQAPIRAEGYGLESAGVRAQPESDLLGCDIQQMNVSWRPQSGAIKVGDRNFPAVRTERQRGTMPVQKRGPQHTCFLAAGGIPNLHGPVPGRRSQAPAAGRSE